MEGLRQCCSRLYPTSIKILVYSRFYTCSYIVCIYEYYKAVYTLRLHVMYTHTDIFTSPPPSLSPPNQWMKIYPRCHLSRSVFLRGTPTLLRSVTSTPTSTPPHSSRRWEDCCLTDWPTAVTATPSPSFSPAGRPAYSVPWPHNSNQCRKLFSLSKVVSCLLSLKLCPTLNPEW